MDLIGAYRVRRHGLRGFSVSVPLSFARAEGITESCTMKIYRDGHNRHPLGRKSGNMPCTLSRWSP